MRVLGLSMSRSNSAALAVTLAAGFFLTAILWSPGASTQGASVGAATAAPTPPRDVPRDPDGGPGRISGSAFQPAPEYGLRLDASPPALELPIPTPKESDLNWRRDRSEKAPSCQLECQYNHNDELQFCGGYLTAEQLAKEGKPAPKPGCRKELYLTLQACMRRCGVQIPDLRVVPAPRGTN